MRRREQLLRRWAFGVEIVYAVSDEQVTGGRKMSASSTNTFETTHRIVRGVSASQARSAIELLYGPFESQLSGIVLPRRREAALELLAASINLGEVYAAVGEDDQALGVALVTGRARSVDVSVQAAVTAFGLLGGWLRYAIYWATKRREASYPRGKRSIEWFSVAPERRGQGVGTALLERIVQDAAEEGASVIELSVGDTNPARHLYERFGFVSTGDFCLGPLARRFGFKRLFLYELRLRGREA